MSLRGAVDDAAGRARYHTRHYLEKSIFYVRRLPGLRTIYTSDKLHACEVKSERAVGATEMREAGVPLKQVGRYTIFDQIGAGGMATVHLARFAGPAGFSRVVAVKHLLPHLSLDTEFRALIVEEARTASRVRHPNVVPTLDVVVD